MSATEQMRAMLDQLMGTSRVGPGTVIKYLRRIIDIFYLLYFFFTLR